MPIDPRHETKYVLKQLENNNSGFIRNFQDFYGSKVELERLSKTEGNSLYSPFGAELNEKISEGIGFKTKFALFMSKVSLVGILESVRNIIFDWSLKLEKSGITGEGMSFSEKDKQRAHEPGVTYQIDNIENFTGNLGPMNHQSSLSVQQLNAPSVEEVKKLLEQIKPHLKNAGLNSQNQELAESQFSELEDEINKDAVEPSKIKKNVRVVENYHGRSCRKCCGPRDISSDYEDHQPDSQVEIAP